MIVRTVRLPLASSLTNLCWAVLLSAATTTTAVAGGHHKTAVVLATPVQPAPYVVGYAPVQAAYLAPVASAPVGYAPAATGYGYAPVGYAPTYGYAPTTGYAPTAGYAPTYGYAPATGYAPTYGYAPQAAAPTKGGTAAAAPSPYGGRWEWRPDRRSEDRDRGGRAAASPVGLAPETPALTADQKSRVLDVMTAVYQNNSSTSEDALTAIGLERLASFTSTEISSLSDSQRSDVAALARSIISGDGSASSQDEEDRDRREGQQPSGAAAPYMVPVFGYAPSYPVQLVPVKIKHPKHHWW